MKFVSVTESVTVLFQIKGSGNFLKKSSTWMLDILKWVLIQDFNVFEFQTSCTPFQPFLRWVLDSLRSSYGMEREGFILRTASNYILLKGTKTIKYMTKYVIRKNISLDTFHRFKYHREKKLLFRITRIHHYSNKVSEE